MNSTDGSTPSGERYIDRFKAVMEELRKLGPPPKRPVRFIGSNATHIAIMNNPAASLGGINEIPFTENEIMDYGTIMVLYSDGSFEPIYLTRPNKSEADNGGSEVKP